MEGAVRKALTGIREKGLPKFSVLQTKKPIKCSLKERRNLFLNRK